MTWKPERLLVFDLKGLMAHFRKFYTNSSSLSYSFPPRTALAGLLASLLGRERDSYYDDFSLEKARIGVALKTPVRKVVQTVNYLFTKDWKLYDRGQGTQIPVEWVLPSQPHSTLCYRIYFAHVKPELVEEAYCLLSEGRYCYPLYLGVTECPAWVEGPRLYDAREMVLKIDPPEPVPLGTVVPVPRLSGDLVLQPGLQIYKDRFPFDFFPGRLLRATGEVFWEAEGRPLYLRPRGLTFRVAEEETFCVFLEME